MSNLILRGRWGGGPDFLLAAATRQHIYIFSLLDFFLYRVQHHTLLQPATSAGAAAGAAAAPGAAAATGAVGPAAEEAAAWPPATMPLPGSCSSSCLVATHRLAHPLAALDWTADARGLLYTDTGQAVAMLQVQGGSAYHLPSRRMVPGKAVVQVAWTATTDTLHTGGWAAGLGNLKHMDTAHCYRHSHHTAHCRHCEHTVLCTLPLLTHVLCTLHSGSWLGSCVCVGGEKWGVRRTVGGWSACGEEEGAGSGGGVGGVG